MDVGIMDVRTVSVGTVRVRNVRGRSGLFGNTTQMTTIIIKTRIRITISMISTIFATPITISIPVITSTNEGLSGIRASDVLFSADFVQHFAPKRKSPGFDSGGAEDDGCDCDDEMHLYLSTWWK